MKCIKAVKPTKYVEVGEIRRINDKEAESEVKGGYWKYAPKSEWKINTRKSKSEDVENMRKKYPANVEGTKEFNESNKKNKNGKNKK
jgi:hypothetical protein